MEIVEEKKLLKDITGNCIAVRLRVLDRAISAIYNRALRPHGLKITQMNIIVAVASFGPVEVRPLCRVLNMDSSTMSRALKRIEAAGYLESAPSGQGKNLMISVTDDGLALLGRAYPDWKAAEQEAEVLLGTEVAGSIRSAGDKMLLAGMSKFS